MTINFGCVLHYYLGSFSVHLSTVLSSLFSVVSDYKLFAAGMVSVNLVQYQPSGGNTNNIFEFI